MDELRHRSLTQLLGECCGVPVSQAFQTFAAAPAAAAVARALGTEPGTAVLHSETLMLSGPLPVDFSQVYYRSDRTFFTAS